MDLFISPVNIYMGKNEAFRGRWDLLQGKIARFIRRLAFLFMEGVLGGRMKICNIRVTSISIDPSQKRRSMMRAKRSTFHLSTGPGYHVQSVGSPNQGSAIIYVDVVSARAEPKGSMSNSIVCDASFRCNRRFRDHAQQVIDMRLLRFQADHD